MLSAAKYTYSKIIGSTAGEVASYVHLVEDESNTNVESTNENMKKYLKWHGYIVWAMEYIMGFLILLSTFVLGSAFISSRFFEKDNIRSTSLVFYAICWLVVLGYSFITSLARYGLDFYKSLIGNGTTTIKPNRGRFIICFVGFLTAGMLFGLVDDSSLFVYRLNIGLSLILSYSFHLCANLETVCAVYSLVYVWRLKNPEERTDQKIVLHDLYMSLANMFINLILLHPCTIYTNLLYSYCANLVSNNCV
ncbi:hypothetical protein NERG_02350 [Nematocida ausubeli]|uniref:Uncharacterized protein n=1 Tax=Nematocida ausubeli (strain ATCC PRA-371 / ERTm2) TaxID=1913371 RepID=H8ZFH9_NEMA1|nr:hypothetical protein NERG_02350 [Nematocida ausubeli]